MTHAITYIPLGSPATGTSRTEALNLTFAKNQGSSTINSSQVQTLANFENGAIYQESETVSKYIEQSPVFDLRREISTPSEPFTSRTQRNGLMGAFSNPNMNDFNSFRSANKKLEADRSNKLDVYYKGQADQKSLGKMMHSQNLELVSITRKPKSKLSRSSVSKASRSNKLSQNSSQKSIGMPMNGRRR